MQTSVMSGFETYISTELCLAQETLWAYMRDVQEFIDFIGTQELTAQTIENFINHLARRGLQPTTIRRKYMSVRCLCHHLISLGRLDSNILGMIDSVRVSKGIPNALDSQVVDTLVATVESRVLTCRATNIRRDVAIILTLYDSGLRVSELCGLNINDISMNQRDILVRGKGGRDRIVPTTKRCIKAIQAYINSSRQFYVHNGYDSLFIKFDGQRITRRAVGDMLMSLSRRAGIEHTTAHMLRRSCATSLMNRGVDLELVQALLGHRHLSTTQTYLFISHDRLKQIHQSCHPFGSKYTKVNRSK